jgi:hypothetical protein
MDEEAAAEFFRMEDGKEAVTKGTGRVHQLPTLG